MRDDLKRAEKKFADEFTRESMAKLDAQMKAGWSPAKSSWHLAKEATAAFIGSCDLAWRNARMALRCSGLAAVLWFTGCSDALPAECQFYQAEIEKAEHCIDIGGCARSAEQEREYIGYMEAELGYCKRRAKMAEGNALKRGP